MDKINAYFKEVFAFPIWWVLLGFLTIEILSFAGHSFELANIVSFWGILLVVFVVSLWRLEYGVYASLAELVIGSKGYLFSQEIFGVDVSLRLGIFLALFAAFVFHVIRERKMWFFDWMFWKSYVAIVLVLVFGVISGVFNGNSVSNVFFDTNGYLFFGLVGPYTQAIRSKKQLQQLVAVLLLATSALITKTLLILFAFSQTAVMEYTVAGLYKWIRDTGVGEITRRDSGFYRVFFQSHIYAILVFFFVMSFFAHAKDWSFKQEKRVYWLYALFAFCMLVIFLSYSRSFWVGTAAAFGVFGLILLFKSKVGLKHVLFLGVVLMLTAAVDYGIALGIVNFPLAGKSSISASQLLTERTQNLGSEAAAASRWNLLPVLNEAVKEKPLLGSGLGATVTYKSEDFRVLEDNPDGMYTTYAFEWGYQDLLYKFGIVGTIIFLGALLRILYRAWQAARKPEYAEEMIGVLVATVALLAVHVFTPYLNHPLGIGWLIVASLLIAHRYQQHA